MFGLFATDPIGEVSMELAETCDLLIFRIFRKGEIAAHGAESGPSKKKWSLWDQTGRWMYTARCWEIHNGNPGSQMTQHFWASAISRLDGASQDGIHLLWVPPYAAGYSVRGFDIQSVRPVPQEAGTSKGRTAGGCMESRDH
jgi:hypothetical protein